MAESGVRLQLVADNWPQRSGPDAPREPLWRHMLGGRLRTLRHERGETLIETAQRAGVSSQYLSEIERGVKEPSSEVIAAVARALEVTLLDLTISAADDIRATQASVHRAQGSLRPAQGSLRPAQTGIARNAASLQAFALAA